MCAGEDAASLTSSHIVRALRSRGRAARFESFTLRRRTRGAACTITRCAPISWVVGRPSEMPRSRCCSACSSSRADPMTKRLRATPGRVAGRAVERMAAARVERLVTLPVERPGILQGEGVDPAVRWAAPVQAARPGAAAVRAPRGAVAALVRAEAAQPQARAVPPALVGAVVPAARQRAVGLRAVAVAGAARGQVARPVQAGAAARARAARSRHSPTG